MAPKPNRKKPPTKPTKTTHTKAMTLVDSPPISEQIRDRCAEAQHIVLLVAQIDPDAIGSAMLFRHYLQARIGVSSSMIEMYYAGAVSHPQNKCIFNMFELDNFFQPLPSTLPKKEGTVWVLLDSCSLTDIRFSGSAVDLSQVDIIIDHHKKDVDQDDEDKRVYFMESIGAAATLVVQLLDNDEEDLESLEDTDEKTTALTLGAIGIKGDTRNFTSGITHEKDFEAFAKLYPYCDKEAMLAVENFPLDRFYPILKEVLNSLRLTKGRILASAGYIDEEDGDLLAEACAQLIRDSRVGVVVVWGAVKGTSKIRLSFRSKDTTLNLHDKIREVFGGGAKQKKGFGEGGAVLDIGDLGTLDISGAEGEDYQNKLLDLIEALIEMRVSIMLRD